MKRFRLILLGIISIIVAVYGWPYLSSSSKNSVAHVTAAIDYHNKAAAVANKYGGAEPSVISQSDWEAITNYNRKALAEAEQADIADMDRYYPTYGNHFRDEFIDGLRMTINNNQSVATTASFLKGQLLIMKFGEWYTANLHAIRGEKQ